jgi:hypothetical protein
MKPPIIPPNKGNTMETDSCFRAIAKNIFPITKTAIKGIIGGNSPIFI